MAKRFDRRRAAQHESRLELLGLIKAEGPTEQATVARPQCRVDFSGCPDVIDPLDSVGLRVERRDESARRLGHLAQDKAEGLLGDAVVLAFSGPVVNLSEEFSQLSLIVKHLLEMRDVPASIGAVAVETASQVIDDSPGRDVIERVCDDRVGLLIVRMPGGELQELELRRLWKLRHVGLMRIEIDSSELRIARLDQRLVGRGHEPALEFDGGRIETGTAEPPHFVANLLGILFDAGSVGAPSIAHARQHRRESRLAGTILRRKVCSSRERRAVRSQEHREGPASRIGRADCLCVDQVGGHIDVVDVGPLFAIDLDVDEVGVHHASDVFVLKDQPLHHVAPVAAAIADREKDRFAFPLGLLKDLGRPGVPVDWIVRVQQQIGTGLAPGD